MNINEFVKLVNDKVQGKQSSKTASVTNKPDELGLLKALFHSTNNNFILFYLILYHPKYRYQYQ